MLRSALASIVVCSMWRNDADKLLAERALHLLDKRLDYADLRFLWVVGDSDDATEDGLRRIIAHTGTQGIVRLISFTSGIGGDDVESRMQRLSVTANVWLDNMPPGVDYCLIHESDLQSPPNICSLFAIHAQAGREVVAGWPTLEVGGRKFFYDTWAYRAGGFAFSNYPPYHPAYVSDEPFIVDSVGSCWMFPARAIDASPRVRCQNRAVLDMCASLRSQGYAIWVDPRIEIHQPAALWQPALPAPDLAVRL